MKKITDIAGNEIYIDVTKIYIMKIVDLNYYIYIGTQNILVTEETYIYILSFVQ